MAVPVNRIGTFTFLTLRGNPEPLKRQLELASRAGVDGITATRTGKRGVPFTLQSGVDTATRAAARTLFTQYVQSIGTDPVQLTWYDLGMVGESFKVLVRDVRPVDVARIINSSGGISGTTPALGYLVCDWDLIAVSY